MQQGKNLAPVQQEQQQGVRTEKKIQTGLLEKVKGSANN